MVNDNNTIFLSYHHHNKKQTHHIFSVVSYLFFSHSKYFKNIGFVIRIISESINANGVVGNYYSIFTLYNFQSERKSHMYFTNFFCFIITSIFLYSDLISLTFKTPHN